MKSHFPAYYRVNRERILNEFNDCLIVFDASALLDIFRLSKDTTERVFDVLQHYKKQVRIPNHAAWEYNKDIITVLSDQMRKVDEASSTLNQFVQLLSTKRNQPYISDKSNRHLKTFQNSIEKDFKEQRKYLEEQMLYGELQNRMSDMLENCVLDAFSNDELDVIKRTGEERYKKQIPPGWKDAEKGDNRYGDLINWKEILRLAKQNQKSVLFISNDQKEDWVIEKHGKRVYPQYELLTEFYSEVTNKELWFHIYTLDSFLDFINKKDAAIVSTETVEIVRDSLAGAASGDTLSVYNLWKSIQDIPSVSTYSPAMKAILSTQKLLESQSLRPSWVDKLSSYENPVDTIDILKTQVSPILEEDSLDAIKGFYEKGTEDKTNVTTKT